MQHKNITVEQAELEGGGKTKNYHTDVLINGKRYNIGVGKTKIESIHEAIKIQSNSLNRPTNNFWYCDKKWGTHFKDKHIWYTDVEGMEQIQTVAKRIVTLTEMLEKLNSDGNT